MIGVVVSNQAKKLHTRPCHDSKSQEKYALLVETSFRTEM